MTIDDIFFPAIEGNLLMLETRLRAREVDLNQMLDAGVNNGYRTQLPLLFSVLNKMHIDGVNTQVLKKLIRYGADPNGYVILENNIETMKIPLLTYVLCDWDNPEMAEFLLTHGADPNAIKEIRRQDGHTSTYPMLYFTLINKGPNSSTLLEMMLKHGADPNEYVNLFIAFGKYYQYLPPVYYALVDQQDRVKLVLLFRYGASPQITIDVGYGVAPKTDFQRYIQMVHPKLSDMLVSCFEASQLHPQQKPQDQQRIPGRSM
ncbi:MAG: hypothetical protein IKK75_00765 [Clostridia bacterium]|nr:hypothetical protein [Clostridia bacterium]